MTLRPNVKPIPTKAYGHLFRSRLEARWAVAFTEEKIEWAYEPEGFDLGIHGWYLPDFWLSQVSMWAEIKARPFTETELRKAALLALGTGFPCLLLVGPPSDCAYWAVMPETDGPDWIVSCGGVLAEAMDFKPFEGHRYHLNEHRFFACTGESPNDSFPMPHDANDCQPYSIVAALSAQFEHGEKPCIKPKRYKWRLG